MSTEFKKRVSLRWAKLKGGLFLGWAKLKEGLSLTWAKLKKRSYLLIAAGVAIGVGLTLLTVFMMDRAKSRELNNTKSTEDEALFPVLSPHAEAKFDRDIKGDCIIAGTVRTDQDEPVSDAEVGIRILWEPWSDPQPAARVKTNATGRFAFKGVRRDYSYQLWVYSPTHGIAQYIQPECGAETEMVPGPSSRLTLRFIKSDGSPAPNVRFLLAGDLLWPAREGTTNGKGEIDIIGLEPGEYVLWASGDNLGYISEEPVQLEPGKQAVGEIELQPAGEVAINVRDSKSGKYSLGALVSVASSSTALLRRVTTTDENGRAAVKGLPAGSYAVSVAAPGHIMREARSLRPGDEVTLKLVKGASVKGYVRLEDGRPVEGAEVNVQEERGGALLALPDSEGRRFKRRILVAEESGFPSLYRVGKNVFTPGPINIPLPKFKSKGKKRVIGEWGLTNKDGGFVLEGLSAGQLVLGAKHPDYVVYKKLRVALELGMTHSDGVILVRSGMTARIRILDERGYPIPDSEITVYDTNGDVLSNHVGGSDGFATIKGLPEIVRIEATADDRVPAFAKIEGKLGTESSGEISLPRADKTLFGRLLDENGFGIGGVEVVARAASDSLLHVVTAETGSDGTFRIDGVGDGNYEVSAEVEGRGRVQDGRATFQRDVTLAFGGTRPAIRLQQPVLSRRPTRPSSSNQWHDSQFPPENLGTNQAGSSDQTGGNPARPGSPGQVLDTTITEFGPADTLPVTGDSPSGFRSPSPGTRPARGQGGLPLTLGMKGGKVIVRNLVAGSELADTGLTRGDRILEVDGVPAKGLAGTRKAILGPIGSVVMLKVSSGGDEFTVVVQRVKVSKDK